MSKVHAFIVHDADLDSGTSAYYIVDDAQAAHDLAKTCINEYRESQRFTPADIDAALEELGDIALDLDERCARDPSGRFCVTIVKQALPNKTLASPEERAAAREQYDSEEIRVDDDALLSDCGDGTYWVQAWVLVDGREDSEG